MCNALPPAPGDFCCALVFSAGLVYKMKVGGKHL